MRRFLRFFFHHFYHSLAWTYDLVAAVVSIGRWGDWVQAALPHIRGRRVLELGFGPGHLQIKLHQAGFLTFGLDESWQMIRQAQARLRSKHDPAALSRGYAQHIPFERGSMNSVVATFPSEYIFDEQTLAEIKRVLTADGRLVIILMAWIDGHSLLDRAAQTLFRITGQGTPPTADVEEAIKAPFVEAGFRAEILREEIRQSVVLVLIAEKPENAESTPPA